jgi:hypothetical protein
MVRRHDNKLVLNAGSVGNAFRFAYSPGKPVYLLPWAEYMIVSQNGDSLSVDARRVDFDTGKLIEKVKESQLPCTPWWLSQYPK